MEHICFISLNHGIEENKVDKDEQIIDPNVLLENIQKFKDFLYAEAKLNEQGMESPATLGNLEKIALLLEITVHVFSSGLNYNFSIINIILDTLTRASKGDKNGTIN